MVSRIIEVWPLGCWSGLTRWAIAPQPVDVQTYMPLFNGHPIIGFFTDRDTAERCLRELRKSGFQNEQIAVSHSDSTVLSAANDPGVYRTTGQGNSGSEIQDFNHLDDQEAVDAPPGATPNTKGFDIEAEAKRAQQHPPGVVVSIQAEPERHEEARELLHIYGAQLADWPASEAA